MKFILTCGGRGTRIKEITGGVIPKSLVRIIDKPLVSYQLELIKQAGINEVYIAMNEEWETQLFKESVRIHEFPALNYYFSVVPWGHPLNNFMDNGILEFIGSEDFYWSYGDIIYNEHLLDALYEVAHLNNTSVGCRAFAKNRKLLDGKYINFVQGSSGKIIGYQPEDEYDFTIHAPFYFKNSALDDIKEELSIEEPRTIRLLTRIIDHGGLSIVEPEFYINMNLPEDVDKVIKFLQNIK